MKAETMNSSLPLGRRIRRPISSVVAPGRVARIAEGAFWLSSLSAVAIFAYFVISGSVTDPLISSRASVWFSTVFALYLLRILLTVLFGWPLRSDALRGHILGARPLLALFFSLISLSVIPSSADLPFLLLSREASIGDRILGGVGAFALSFPFFLILFFPARWWKSSRALRIERAEKNPGVIRRLLHLLFAPIRLTRDLWKLSKRNRENRDLV